MRPWRRRWSLIIAVGLISALLPVSGAFADGNHSPVECNLSNNVNGGVAVAPDGFVIDAICIKSGDNAFPERAPDHQHSALITADGTYGDGFTVEGIGTQTVTVSADGKEVSHLDFSVVETPGPEGLLSVEKTAEGTFDRTHDWSIAKTVDPEEIDLYVGGDPATAIWDIVVTYDGYTDSNQAVTGEIEISNGETLFNARIDSVVDDLGDVECGVTFPHDLAPGDSITCDYSITTDQAGTNEVTVEGEYEALVGDGANNEAFSETDTADFDFDGDPTNEAHATVNVTDLSDLGDLLGGAYTAEELTLEAGDYVAGDTEEFTYSNEFDTDECGVFDNTASVIGDGDEVLDSDDASVTVNCFGIEVTKTADATFDRTHDWSIEKSADQTLLQLAEGESGSITWTVDVTYEGATDSNHAVVGTISVENLGDSAITIDSIDDVLSTGEIGTVECPDAFPFDIAAGDTVDCSYEVDATAAVDGTNTATVTGTFANEVGIDEQATEDYTFVLDTELHATVNVDDLSSEFGATDFGSLDAADFASGESEEFTYSEDFTYEGLGTCQELTIDNTATVSSTDGFSDTADETVVVETECIVFEGETATGDGIDWKLTKRSPNNWFMYSMWSEIAALDGTDLIAGQYYDVGDVTGTRNGTTTLNFSLGGDWELADLSGNVKVNPMSCTTKQNYVSPGKFAVQVTVDPDDSGSFSVSGLSNTECYGIHLDVGRWVSLGFGDLD